MHLGRRYEERLALLEAPRGRGGRRLTFDPNDHPRDRLGRFIETINSLQPRQSVSLPDGTRVQRDPDGTFRVVRYNRIVSGFAVAGAAAMDALDRSARATNDDNAIGGRTRYQSFESWNASTTEATNPNVVKLGTDDIHEKIRQIENDIEVARSNTSNRYQQRRVTPLRRELARLRAAVRTGQHTTPASPIPTGTRINSIEALRQVPVGTVLNIGPEGTGTRYFVNRSGSDFSAAPVTRHQGFRRPGEGFQAESFRSAVTGVSGLFVAEMPDYGEPESTGTDALIDLVTDASITPMPGTPVTTADFFQTLPEGTVLNIRPMNSRMSGTPWTATVNRTRGSVATTDTGVQLNASELLPYMAAGNATIVSVPDAGTPALDPYESSAALRSQLKAAVSIGGQVEDGTQIEQITEQGHMVYWTGRDGRVWSVDAEALRTGQPSTRAIQVRTSSGDPYTAPMFSRSLRAGDVGLRTLISEDRTGSNSLAAPEAHPRVTATPTTASTPEAAATAPPPTVPAAYDVGRPPSVPGGSVRGDAMNSIIQELHGFRADGYVARVSSANQYGEFYVNIIHEATGANAGRASRNMNSDTSMYHASFSMERQHKGSGFGTEFIEASFQAYRNAGLRHVDVGAGLTVGGYQWAKMGFKLKGQTLKSFWSSYGHKARQAASEGKVPQALVDELDRQIEDEVITSIQQLAAWGRRTSWDGAEVNAMGQPHKLWLGKFILLGASWNGRKTL